MTESYFDLRARLTAKYGVKTLAPLRSPEVDAQKEAERLFAEANKIDPIETAFVISPPNSDKLYVTGRVKAEAWDTPVNRAFSYVVGRYVQAETANKNGAYWTAEDLQFGAPSVAFGPVNLLHEERAIVGTISEAHLHGNDERYGTHISTCNVLWKYLYPQAVQAVEKASEGGELWQSMECVGEQIQCVGCDSSFDYGTWMRNKSSGCEHLTKGGVRRIVRPTFLATGLIFGAARPAWGDADVELRKESAKLAEMNHLYEGSMTRDCAESMVAQILTWANSR